MFCVRVRIRLKYFRATLSALALTLVRWCSGTLVPGPNQHLAIAAILQLICSCHQHEVRVRVQIGSGPVVPLQLGIWRQIPWVRDVGGAQVLAGVRVAVHRIAGRDR